MTGPLTFDALLPKLLALNGRRVLVVLAEGNAKSGVSVSFTADVHGVDLDGAETAVGLRLGSDDALGGDQYLVVSREGFQYAFSFDEAIRIRTTALEVQLWLSSVPHTDDDEARGP